ncbi:peptidylprolyl isomerase [Paenibacillus thermotolerans]|uniref:peptidylprolyl isomerase n=1 Tax=Paenibacillus thermotolerans TaxID=3027807 RepID=UPI002367E4D6|nr:MULTISPECIES: peptidylprolyl isomerase [unclassified Paenibacillus]
MNFIRERIWMLIAVILLIVLVGVVWLNPFQKQGSAGLGGAVAKVNGVSISKEQLYDEMYALGGDQTLQNMIDEELIRQEAEKAGVTITDADIDKEIDKVKSSFGSDEEFEYTLASYGMTLDSLKENMKTQVQLRKLLEPQVTVTDDDIKAYFDENLESLQTPEQMRASHILVETKEEAEAILKQLKEGADFAELAKEKSTDTQTAPSGGDLDFFERGRMEQAFDTAAFALKPGELSDIVETSYGYHIIKATDHKDAVTPTLDEKKDEIKETLVSSKVSEMSMSWIDEKRQAAKIEQF